MADDLQKATDGELYGASAEPNVVEIIKRLKQESKDARFPREMEWNRAWNLYNGIYDWTQKADWQNKISLPRVNTAVRSAAYLLKRGLVGPRDFYQTDGIGTISKMVAPYAHKTAMFHLQRRGADRRNAVNHYVTSLMSGMLTSLVVLKVYPSMEYYEDVEYEWPKGGPVFPRSPMVDAPRKTFLIDDEGNSGLKRKKRKRLVINHDPVNAYDYYKDPRGEGLYRIHTIDMDYFRLKEMEKAGKVKEGTCARIDEDFVKVEKEQQDAARSSQYVPYVSYARKRVTVDEYWGDLIEPGTGRLLFKDCYAMMVNDKFMAVDPGPSKLPTQQKHPFIEAPLIEKPFSAWHQGFVESVAGIAETLTELMCLTLDSNLFAQIKSFELDIDQVYDPTEFANGIYPGKTFKKRGGGMSTAPMIRDISLGNFNPQVMEVFLGLDREFQSGTGLNEYITPQMRQRTGRVSATEMIKKSQESSDFFGEIAKCQEEWVIEPMIELDYEYIMHYQRDFDDPLLMEILGPDVAKKAGLLMADKELREFLISNPLKVRAFGMSEIAKRMKELDKIMAFINLAGNFAKVDPTILQRMKVTELFKKAIAAFNWNEDEVMNMEEQPIAAPRGLAGAPSPNPQPTAGLPPNSPPNPSLGVHGHAGPSAAVGG